MKFRKHKYSKRGGGSIYFAKNWKTENFCQSIDKKLKKLIIFFT